MGRPGTQPSVTGAAPTADESATVFRHYHAAFNEALHTGDTDGIDRLVAVDYVEHQGGAGTPQGREGLKRRIDAFRTAVPDFVLDAEEVIAQGDLVAVRLLARGTHEGNFLGIPPTGVAFAIESMDSYRVADGRIVEHWGVTDNLGFLTQIGVFPPPNATPAPDAP